MFDYTTLYMALNKSADPSAWPEGEAQGKHEAVPLLLSRAWQNRIFVQPVHGLSTHGTFYTSHAYSQSSATGFIFVFVQVRLRHGFCRPICHLLRSFTCVSFNGFEAAVSAPCGRVANARFLACLSSDLGGVWPFRIRCQRASFLSLCRLGCLPATVLYLCLFTVSKLQFRQRVEGLRTHGFWLAWARI